MLSFNESGALFVVCGKLLSKFMMYPDCMYVILTTCIKDVNTIVLINIFQTMVVSTSMTTCWSSGHLTHFEAMTLRSVDP